MPDKSPNRGAFLSLLLTVFIDLLGIGIIIPVLAAIFFLPSGPFFTEYSEATKNLLYGLMIAAYPFGQFIAAPILGDLSDKYGRRKLLLVSIFGTIVGYLISGFGIMAGSLEWLLVGRLIDGLTGGNIAIAYSAISDLSTPQTKPKNFGLAGMAFGLGFIVGPYLGGLLSDPQTLNWFTFATPFWLAALAAGINLILVFLTLPETLRHPRESRWSLWKGVRNIAKAFAMKDIRVLLLVVFLLTFGFSFFTQFFQIFLIEKFQYDQRQIGEIFGYIGLWIILVQGLVIRPISKRFPASKVLIFSIVALALIFPIILLPSKAAGLFLIMPFVALFQGITQPNITTVISNRADERSQGEILGINQSMQSLAQTIPPLIAAVIIGFNASLPLLVASVTTFVAWILYLLAYRQDSREKGRTR